MYNGKITAVLSYPYDDKLVIKVFRQLDRFHVPISRLYISDYLHEQRVKQLMKRFIQLNKLVQEKTINDRILERKQLYENKP